MPCTYLNNVYKKRGQDKVFQRIIGRYTFKSDNPDRTPRDARSPTDQEKMCSSSLASSYGELSYDIRERLKKLRPTNNPKPGNS